jgi:hypothetical protein
MRLVQFKSDDGSRRVGLVQEDGAALRVLRDTPSVYDLALEADRLGRTLEHLVEGRSSDEVVDYERVMAERRILPPLDHPDPAHCYVTGTGLTHLGSAQARDEMHVQDGEDVEAKLTDSMRLFQWGLEGGKPPKGQIGVQPEWFYRGDGTCVVPPGQPLELPSFALDGGEEAELVGLYVIAEPGVVLRVGFALGNEFSDHVMERQNYLYLAHSKLRTCSMGPELLMGQLPSSIIGRVRVLRDGAELWADTFRTGEVHMSYTVANIEHHHFKYARFRRPGDVHCHFFGTATLSHSAGIVAQPGDVFEISAVPFGRPLRNPLVQVEEGDDPITVKPL